MKLIFFIFIVLVLRWSQIFIDNKLQQNLKIAHHFIAN